MVILKNYMEYYVAQSLDRVILNGEHCSCKNCYYDVMAIALNNLPPKYIVSEKGQIFASTDVLNYQYSVDVFAAITKAMNIVTENPRHDRT